MLYETTPCLREVFTHMHKQIFYPASPFGRWGVEKTSTMDNNLEVTFHPQYSAWSIPAIEKDITSGGDWAEYLLVVYPTKNGYHITQNKEEQCIPIPQNGLKAAGYFKNNALFYYQKDNRDYIMKYNREKKIIEHKLIMDQKYTPTSFIPGTPFILALSEGNKKLTRHALQFTDNTNSQLTLSEPHGQYIANTPIQYIISCRPDQIRVSAKKKDRPLDAVRPKGSRPPDILDSNLKWIGNA